MADKLIENGITQAEGAAPVPGKAAPPPDMAAAEGAAPATADAAGMADAAEGAAQPMSATADAIEGVDAAADVASAEGTAPTIADAHGMADAAADAASAEGTAPATPEAPSGRKGRIALISALIVALALAVFGGWQYAENTRLEKELEKLDTTYTEAYRYVNSLTVPRFEGMVASGEDFLVSIGRPSCPYCREMDPAFVRLVQELEMTEDIYYLNIARIHGDQELWPKFKEKYGFFYTPAYVHYAGGEVVSAMDGDFTEDDLRDWLIDNGAK
ncbi:MAG: hypothetical protein LBH39_02485 [Clostridiales Family XIII bacterium]|nr:hypothetical protein [Clostridiales Family XIII bacterium]